MGNYQISLKIQLLVQFIYDKKFPSKESILAYFEKKDMPISSRTLERYFEKIRSDFGIEITYNSKEKGYYIDEDKSVKVASFFNFLEIVQVADVFNRSLQDSHSILEYVGFDDSNNFQGIENLKILLLAIKEQREISFQHQNYESNSEKKYQCTPLILKEYLNRWYVVCGINKKEIRTFGNDRMSEIAIEKPSQNSRVDYAANLAKFEHTVGLTYGEGAPEKVSLLIDKLHVKYLRSLPLHHSQIIHPKNTNNKHQVDFYLYPNYEFVTQILKIGAEAEVIHPLSLRAEIKSIVERMLGNYE